MGATKNNTYNHYMNIANLNHQLSNGEFTHDIIDIANANIASQHLSSLDSPLDKM
jgi:hypothetical protein